MLILQLYDYITGYHVQNEPYMIDFCKIIYNLIGLLQNLFGAYIYFFNNSLSYCELFAETVLNVTVFDWFFIQDPIIYIHHSIIFALYYVYKNFDINLETYKSTYLALLGTEMSTLFLCMRNMIQLTGYFSQYQTFVSSCFAIVFIYTRVYVCGKHTLFELPEGNYVLKSIMYVLLAMNLYWTSKIIKKASLELGFTQKK